MNITEEDKVQEALGLKNKYRIWLEVHEKDLDAPYRISENVELIAVDVKEIQNKIGEQLKQEAISYILQKHIPDLQITDIYAVIFNITIHEPLDNLILFGNIDNAFNSAEDLVQYALGSMDVYSIVVESKDGRCGACYPGIIAMSHSAALMKFLWHYPKEAQDSLLQVNLCE